MSIIAGLSHNNMPKRTKAFSLFIQIILCFLLASCSSKSFINQSEVTKILNELEKESANAEIISNRGQAIGLYLAELTNKAAPLSEQYLSVDLDDVKLGLVIDHLGLDYVLHSTVNLETKVSASFNNIRFDEAINRLLEPAQLEARVDDSVMSIRHKRQVILSTNKNDTHILKKYHLRYADSKKIGSPLKTLMGINEDDDESSDPLTLRIAIVAEENAILIQGKTTDVENAITMLKALDVDHGHVLIQVMVLAFSGEKLMDIGTKISDGAKNKFSNVSIDWANLTGETISFTNLVDAANTSTFRAAISLLINNGYAEVVSRPYLATVSGEKATLESVVEQYVTVVSGNQEFSLESVNSGVTLDILPIVLRDGKIRLDLDVSSSQFVPSLNNASLARGRNKASSTVRIGSGQSLVIGGLINEESAKIRSGIPYLNRIPVIGSLFGGSRDSINKQRLLIYITPYIWEPGLETPANVNRDIKDFVQDWSQSNNG